LADGAEALNDDELLAIILRTGSSNGDVLDLAKQLLVEAHGLDGIARAAIPELCKLKGLGPTKAIELKAAFELGKRAVRLDPSLRPVIHSPADVYSVVGSGMALLESEQIQVILLNTKNRVMLVHKIADGSANRTATRIAEVFREAVRHQSTRIILVHNHPSGDPRPSSDDVAFTRDVCQAGALLEIDVLDHIVIGRGGNQPWASLRELGLAFAPATRT
jgi:DNA repair protein RadC